jgi:Heparan-alpha-glucosaminide N-acetyltransferase, catalytic
MSSNEGAEDLVAPQEEKTDAERKRIRWIDQARGFVIVYMVIFIFVDDDWVKGNPVTEFLFTHPSSTATYMTLYDVGTAAFIFILGLLYSYSFWKRQKKASTGKAIGHVVIRYGLILLLGLLIIIADAGEITEEKTLDDGVTTITVVIWDVVPSLGLVGLVAIPLVFLKPKQRIGAGYMMLIFYQIMLSLNDSTGWKTYAWKSTHGGILGTIFGLSAILVIGSGLGELLFEGVKTDSKGTYTKWAIFGAVNFILGVILQYVPTLEANKRIVSATYIMISIGVIMLASLLFVWIDQILDKNVTLFDAYGKNPFLIYVMAIIPEFLLYEYILEDPEVWVQIVILVIAVIIISLIALTLYKKSSVVSTEKVALITIIVVGGLAGILIAAGVI